MKIQVKETLARRLTVFVLTLAAIVGVCAFAFSGTQNYAWAEGETPIATWNEVKAPGYGVVKANEKNLSLEIKIDSSNDHLEAHFTNNDGDTIHPSVLELTTEDGSVLTAYFGEDILPTNQAASSIEGSKPTTRFTKAELYETVTVSFESEYGTTPEAVTVNKGQVVELPDLGTDGDYKFVGWIPKGSEGTDPLKGEYTAKENITFTAVWETPTIEMVDVTFDMNGHGDTVDKQTEKGKPITLIDDPTAEGYTFKGWTYDKEGKQAFDAKKNADQNTTLYAQWEKNVDSTPTNSIIPRTGDNQMALLASLCFSAAALSAVGIALIAYRKRKHA